MTGRGEINPLAYVYSDVTEACARHITDDTTVTCETEIVQFVGSPTGGVSVDVNHGHLGPDTSKVESLPGVVLLQQQSSRCVEIAAAVKLLLQRGLTSVQVVAG
ncbi:hypothetical protein HAX54_050435 [Datura stramonium]|uniref:Uncharacterized protein n=1 Tax=Datura stramonium TaxID=4076 RepID=A0ABS8SXA4_DATST|nr:hypothetical protein [Datura stramonium]